MYVNPAYDECNEIRDVIAVGLATWNPVEIADELDIVPIVERLVGIHNEPVATATWFSHDIVCGAVSARGGGLGGDELNAGEYEYFPPFFADLRAAGEIQNLAAEIDFWARHHDHPIHRKNPDVAVKLMAELTALGSSGHTHVAQFGQQFALNHLPALHDQVALGSIHFAGFMILSSKTHHARNGRPYPNISPLAAKYTACNRYFAKGSHGKVN